MRVALICLLLGGCATPVIDGCAIFGPIHGSKQDTPETRSQIDEHNAKGVGACGWRRGGMSVETDTRDRVIRLEEGFVNFKGVVKDDLDAHGAKIDEMYTLLTRARGIGWLGVAMLGVAGSIGGLIMWVWQNFPSFGR